MKNNIISECRICGEGVVVTLAEACEFPLCSRLKCFKEAFPDDYMNLITQKEGLV